MIKSKVLKGVEKSSSEFFDGAHWRHRKIFDCHLFYLAEKAVITG